MAKNAQKAEIQPANSLPVAVKEQIPTQTDQSSSPGKTTEEDLEKDSAPKICQVKLSTAYKQVSQQSRLIKRNASGILEEDEGEGDEDQR